MALDVVESEETEDHYVVTLSFRPQGEFSGWPGREQFFIAKEGNVADRQVIALPRQRRRIPAAPTAIGLVVGGVIAVIALVIAFGQGGGEAGGSLSVASAQSQSADPATAPPAPTSAPATTSTPSVGPPNTPQPALTVTPRPTPTQSPTFTPKQAPSISQELDLLVSDAGLENNPNPDNGGLEVFSTQSVAQTFTVPSDGTITGVEILDMGRQECASLEDLNFRLLSTVEGFPDLPSFYTVALPAQDIAIGGSNLKIDFPQSVTVGAFQTLALEFSTAASGADGCIYGWSGDRPGQYLGGQTFSRSGETQAWQPDSRDLGFRMFFEEAAATPVPLAIASPTAPLQTGEGSTVVLTLGELNGSGQSGNATLFPLRDRTRVVLNFSGGAMRSELVHIHQGQCGDNLGGVDYPLTSFVGGSGLSNTTVEVSLDILQNGDHAINVHERGDPAVYTACSNIPR